jgi:hypothetical protein
MFGRVTSVLRSQAFKRNPGLVARLATLVDYRAFEYRLKRLDTKGISGRAADIVIELERNGICIIDNFWPAEDCAAACAEVDRIIVDYPDYVNPNAKADKRVYGADNASELISRFANDETLREVASAYNREETVTAFTLAARMPASGGNQGSGEGWHRDAFLRQFKAIMYLTDVGPENGPFQIIRDSHRLPRVLGDMKSGNLKYMQYRLEDHNVAHILENEPKRLCTYPARAGALVLVDTSSVHRGKPIETGTRYALTNYYYKKNSIDKNVYEKFSVLPKS